MTKFFYYLFLEYLILHYETAVVVLRHREIEMSCVIIKYMMDIIIWDRYLKGTMSSVKHPVS